MRLLMLALCVSASLAAAPLHESAEVEAALARVASLPVVDVLAVRSKGDPVCPQLPQPVELPSPRPGGVTAALDALQAVLDASTDPVAIPGMSAAVAYRGAIINVITKGFANVSSGSKVGASTPFRIGSVTKVFSAVLVLQAASAGLIQLDDPVAIAVPDFSVINPFGADKVTWRQLLAQRSGLQREAPQPANSTDEALKEIAQTFLLRAPGGQPSYSNLGFALAGNLIAERVVGGGHTFTSLVRDWIVEPAALRHTGNEYGPGVPEGLAVPYLANGDPSPFYNLGWSDPAGSMYSSPSDLASLAAALMQAARGEGPLAPSIRQDIAAAFMDPDYRNPDGLTLFGWPWEMRVAGSFLLRRKGGNIPGSTALMSFVPELETAIAVTWNGGQDEFTLATDAWAAFLTNFTQALAALQPSPFHPGPRYQDYVGTYSFRGLLNASVLFDKASGSLVAVVDGVVSIYINDASAVTGRPDTYQAYLPPDLLPCLAAELQAIGGEYFLFTRGTNGQVNSMSVPGYIPALVFQRVA